MSDPFAPLSAALSGRFRLERELGAGGMATVYLAHDLKHKRAVAIKVLRPEIARALGVDRFLREIRLTAMLSHPNILPLLDSGEAGDLLYYVMPFVAGESLRQRLTREKQLPVDEAVQIAREVADALTVAHSHGVVHRDIKPENVLLASGKAVVADFGIARAVSAAGGSRLTDSGVAVGTPAYMSPEQASGEAELDPRTDIYSLGCVLYEMLVGEPPFTGPTAQAITARKLTERPPPITPVRDTVPESLEATVRRALARVPADRFPTAHAFGDALERARTARSPQPTLWDQLGARRRVSAPRWVAWVAAIGGLVVAAVGAWGWARPRATPLPSRAWLAIPLGEGNMISGWSGTRVALSPDGRHAVWASPHRGPSLRLRRLDGSAVSPIGTADATHPFFSPDGEWLGFFTGDRIVKVPLAGGALLPVAPAAGAVRGASWGGDVIVFAAGAEPGLMVVSAAGGEPRVLTVPDTAGGDIDHRWPEVLPNGRAVLFTIWNGQPGRGRIAVARLPGGEVTVLAGSGVSPKFRARPGQLVYAQPDGSLLAVPFDAARLAVTGSAVPFIEGVSVKPEGIAEYALGNDGTLLFFRGAERANRTLVSVDRRGLASLLVNEQDSFTEPRVSPDGARIAVAIGLGEAYDVWVYDLRADTKHRITQGGYNRRPAWSPDGRRVLFSSGRPGLRTEGERRRLFAAPADGAGTPAVLLETEGELREVESFPRGDRIAYAENDPSDLGIAEIGEHASAHAIIATRGHDVRPRVSPDGRWLAYMSNESGQYEIFIAALPAGEPRWQISRGGGAEPVWSPSGRELFYISNGMMIAARLELDSTPSVRARAELFDARRYVYYDVYPSGDRFLMVEREQPEPQQLTVVLNWPVRSGRVRR